MKLKIKQINNPHPHGPLQRTRREDTSLRLTAYRIGARASHLSIYLMKREELP